ncbi:zinc finger protein RFP-like [Thamnophis elegans]|uniref:zinc finger protein RFP-like n=1 Tax=Thamnophis elegans TaxID=35005 RepID=UPI0013777F58|nr:zinc finger protein RFP-like [Thamnophis elegans]
MDTGKMSEYLPDAVTCTLCMKVLHDPVTLSCGHNFCHACIQRHWGGALSGVLCPQCQQRFDDVTLTANRQLGNVAWLIRKLQDKGVLERPNRGFCEAHKQPLVIFCQDDQAALCTECQESQDHTNHVLASLEGAAQEAKIKGSAWFPAAVTASFFQNEVRVYLDVLKVQKAHLRDCFSNAQTEKGNLKKLTDRDNQNYSSGYKEMYEMMTKVHQDQMKAAKCINDQIEEEMGKLSREHNKVRTFIKELEKKFNQPAYEFLKDFKEVMARCKELLAESPKEHFPEFTEQMWDFSLRGLFVHNTLRRCKANVTMDRLTAHPHLLLSASKKIITHDATPSGLLPGRKAFDTTPCILAEKWFTTGRHCWQVEVTSSGQGWAFGVMKDSVCRKGPVAFSAEEGTWALLPEHLPPAEPKACTYRFRLYLDYEGGIVNFFDVATREPVLLLSYAMFLGERIFPFFKLEDPDSQMRVLP